MAIQNPLGLKTISWDPNKRKFISPARPEFIWTQDGLAEAQCSKQIHESPDEFCMCGIYATFDWIIAKKYDRQHLNVMLLVEAGGKTILHEHGFRSEQLRFIGAIRQEEPAFRLATSQAADFYNIPVMEKVTALAIMDIQNVHLLDWYDPVHLQREQAINLWRMRNTV